MPRIIPTSAEGSRRVWQGLRQGDQKAVLLGAAMIAWNWWRSSARKQKVLIHREVLDGGESVVIRSDASGRLRIDLDRTT